MPAADVPEFWVLAEESQEVLVAGPAAFSQLAPVPLRQLGSDLVAAGEPYRAAAHRHDLGGPFDRAGR